VAIRGFTDTLKTYAIVVAAAVLASQSKPEGKEIRLTVLCARYKLCQICYKCFSVSRNKHALKYKHFSGFVINV
jgi:hypothetical protein